MTSRFRLLVVNLLLMAALTACSPEATATPSLIPPTILPTAPPPTPIPPTAIPTATPPPLPSVTPTPDPLSEIDKFLTKLTENGVFSGVVLLAKDGKVLFNKGYGLADKEQKIPNTPQTRFRIYSITKQFTATAILMLQNRGMLNVQDFFCKYVKDCPEEWKSISIHQLLTHTSGIPDFFGFSDIEAKIAKPMTPVEFVNWVKGKPLDFKPGQKFSYSNSGYNLLGVIIENVSGKSYGTFLKENIFDPLSMSNTGYDPQPANIAVGYKLYMYGYKASLLDLSVAFAAGGLYSTVEDLYKWDQALYTEKILPKNLLDEMFKVQVVPGEEWGFKGYGYGWMINPYNDHPSVFHPGAAYGFITEIRRFLDDKETFILFSNVEDLDLDLCENYIFHRIIK
jgi:CubicO group peptidase (beta-lactamase class C family)